jgi:hypothetical protein
MQIFSFEVSVLGIFVIASKSWETNIAVNIIINSFILVGLLFYIFVTNRIANTNDFIS